MANTLLTADLIIKESQRVFKNETPFLQSMHKGYDKTYEVAGAKSGDTIRIKKPIIPTIRRTMEVSTQNIKESYVTLAKTDIYGADLRFSNKELGLDITEFSDLYIKPTMQRLASELECDIMEQAYQAIGNTVTLPVTAVDREDIAAAMVKLDDFSAPTERFLVMNPTTNGQLVTGNATLFQPGSVGSQYITGSIGKDLYGFNCFRTPNVPTHTRGTANTGYLVNGAYSSGLTLGVDTGSGTFTAGDVITIADVYALNPANGRSTGKLMQIPVTVASAGGTATLTIGFELIASGNPNANVSALPADGADVTVYGAISGVYPQNLAYSKWAFAFGTAAMELPKSAEMATRLNVDGVSMSLIGFYDGRMNETIYRFDILGGLAVPQPEWAVRIPGIN